MVFWLIGLSISVVSNVGFSFPAGTEPSALSQQCRANSRNVQHSSSVLPELLIDLPENGSFWSYVESSNEARTSALQQNAVAPSAGQRQSPVRQPSTQPLNARSLRPTGAPVSQAPSNYPPNLASFALESAFEAKRGSSSAPPAPSAVAPIGAALFQAPSCIRGRDEDSENESKLENMSAASVASYDADQEGHTQSSTSEECSSLGEANQEGHTQSSTREEYSSSGEADIFRDSSSSSIDTNKLINWSKASGGCSVSPRGSSSSSVESDSSSSDSSIKPYCTSKRNGKRTNNRQLFGSEESSSGTENDDLYKNDSGEVRSKVNPNVESSSDLVSSSSEKSNGHSSKYPSSIDEGIDEEQEDAEDDSRTGVCEFILDEAEVADAGGASTEEDGYDYEDGFLARDECSLQSSQNDCCDESNENDEISFASSFFGTDDNEARDEGSLRLDDIGILKDECWKNHENDRRLSKKKRQNLARENMRVRKSSIPGICNGNGGVVNAESNASFGLAGAGDSVSGSSGNKQDENVGSNAGENPSFDLSADGEAEDSGGFFGADYGPPQVDLDRHHPKCLCMRCDPLDKGKEALWPTVTMPPRITDFYSPRVRQANRTRGPRTPAQRAQDRQIGLFRPPQISTKARLERKRKERYENDLAEATMKSIDDCIPEVTPDRRKRTLRRRQPKCTKRRRNLDDIDIPVHERKSPPEDIREEGEGGASMDQRKSPPKSLKDDESNIMNVQTGEFQLKIDSSFYPLN